MAGLKSALAQSAIALCTAGPGDMQGYVNTSGGTSEQASMLLEQVEGLGTSKEIAKLREFIEKGKPVSIADLSIPVQGEVGNTQIVLLRACRETEDGNACEPTGLNSDVQEAMTLFNSDGNKDEMDDPGLLDEDEDLFGDDDLTTRLADVTERADRQEELADKARLAADSEAGLADRARLAADDEAGLADRARLAADDEAGLADKARLAADGVKRVADDVETAAELAKTIRG